MDQANVTNQLKFSLRALSLEAENQIALFPEFVVVVTDELLLDFDHWYDVVIKNYPNLFSTKQIEALDNVWSLTDNYLAETTAYTSEKDELLFSKFWGQLRGLAKEAIIKLNWTEEIQPEGLT